MRFKGLDLNLLVAFEALMETRSASRAAEQLNLSQPAISAALGRLRDFFGDPILVSHGKRMLPTSYAEALRAQVRECLRQAEALIATSATFDPATSQRTFRIVASDYLLAAVMTPLIRSLSKEAPGVCLEAVLPGVRSTIDLDEGKIDLLLTPEGFVSSAHATEFLFEEDYVLVGCRDNPLLRTPITEDEFFSAGHVAVAIGGVPTISFSDANIAKRMKDRRIEVVVPSFTLAVWMVLGTERLAVMHERLARTMANHFELAIQPMPFPVPKLRELAQFHTARAADEGLRWLRQRLREMAEQVRSAN